MSGVFQIPWDGFKLIGIGQTAIYSLYQSLYKDHSEPVGCISVIQAFGQLQPSDKAIQDFGNKWEKGVGRRSFVKEGLEFVTGRSSTTDIMAKMPRGEVAILIISFLIEALGAETTSDLARRIINTTPDHLLSIRPLKEQVTNVVSAIQSQTGNVSWHDEISQAQACVYEPPGLWTSALSVPHMSHDIPVEAMKAFYQVLCTVSRFPNDYHCTLRSTLSISLAFVLAHSICGLKVCVAVDGEEVNGNLFSGPWQVKLERLHGGAASPSTEVKLWRKVENPEVLLQFADVGPRRANRIAIKGIAWAATIGQGLGSDESHEIATLSIWAAEFILQKWQREPVDEWGSNSYISSSEPEDSASLNDTNDTNDSDDNSRLVPVKSRLSIGAICTWWGCQAKKAGKMLNDATGISPNESPEASWTKLPFSNKIMGKITKFEDLDYNQQMERRLRTYHALDRRDFARLTHMLTTQLILITLLKGNDLNPLLEGNDLNQEQVRVRSSCSPDYSNLGVAIKKLNSLKPLRCSDALYSWHYWLHGGPPKTPESNYGLGGPDAIATDGYLIYRSLFLDLNLCPDSCEMVTVQPGYICLDNQRFAEIRGPDDIVLVEGKSYYRKRLQAQAKLKSRDHTGDIDLRWRVAEGDSSSSLDLEMMLKGKSFQNSQLKIEASVYQIAKMSWSLQYGDRSLGCEHEEDRVGEAFEGEKIEVISAGELRKSDSRWEALQLLSAKRNNLGQVACLLSAPPDSRGMVRREACLRCCVTACNERGLDFLID
jgi:hypothetical protein